VAARLGLSAMALYPYVGAKGQLLDLVTDHASAMPAWDDPSASPAADLTAWAEQLLALYERHPWLAERPWAEAAGGPHQQDWLERLLAILHRWDVPDGERAAVVTALYAVVVAGPGAGGAGAGGGGGGGGGGGAPGPRPPGRCRPAAARPRGGRGRTRA
jgi:AcrR family transcriptional regulator